MPRLNPLVGPAAGEFSSHPDGRCFCTAASDALKAKTVRTSRSLLESFSLSWATAGEAASTSKAASRWRMIFLPFQAGSLHCPLVTHHGRAASSGCKTAARAALGNHRPYRRAAENRNELAPPIFDPLRSGVEVWSGSIASFLQLASYFRSTP